MVLCVHDVNSQFTLFKPVCGVAAPKKSRLLNVLTTFLI